MPCLYISTNVCLNGFNADPLVGEATKACASIIGKPKNYIMVILNGSLDISLAGSREPAAYGEIVSIGGINSQVKKRLIDAIASILQTNLSIPRTRFFLKVYDTTAGRAPSKL